MTAKEINIKCDSRLVKPGDTFVAIRGAKEDGAKHIAAALAAGATKIVCEENADNFQLSTFNFQLVTVPDARLELARLACEAYGNPSQKLRVFGVTGTNGKTTVAHLLRQILNDTGNPCGLISTTGHLCSGGCSGGPAVRLALHSNAATIPAKNTTPGPLELQALFAEMLDNGCNSCVMEVSSHAIEQKRIAGINFAALAFTNLTQDHLDYHKTMEAYFEVKKSLFINNHPGASRHPSNGGEFRFAAFPSLGGVPAGRGGSSKQQKLHLASI
ncbi:MAG: Mur ligase family protein [Kiritimatiellaeota bacterium]|nr:Mur ligase family protein [Kiritimatiellota bacterium]